MEDITEYQIQFSRELVNWLAHDISIVFPSLVCNRKEIEEILVQFNTDGLDGTILVMMMYAPLLTATQAIEDNILPLHLENLKLKRTVTVDWDMASLTYNQGIHGIQDMANCIIKLGVRPFSGSATGEFVPICAKALSTETPIISSFRVRRSESVELYKLSPANVALTEVHYGNRTMVLYKLCGAVESFRSIVRNQ